MILVTCPDEHVSHISTGGAVRTQSSAGFSIGYAFRSGVLSVLFYRNVKVFYTVMFY